MNIYPHRNRQADNIIGNGIHCDKLTFGEDFLVLPEHIRHEGTIGHFAARAITGMSQVFHLLGISRRTGLNDDSAQLGRINSAMHDLFSRSVFHLSYNEGVSYALWDDISWP